MYIGATGQMWVRAIDQEGVFFGGEGDGLEVGALGAAGQVAAVRA